MPWSSSRPSRESRGYDRKHQQLRAKLLPSAYGKPCTRCGKPMLPGQALHLDHTDNRSGYLGFAHASCNRNAGASKGARVANTKRKARRTGHGRPDQPPTAIEATQPDSARFW